MIYGNRITEYNDMKKRVDKFINDINSEYKSIKKDIDNLFQDIEVLYIFSMIDL